jgi:hypothetical protein
LAQGGYIHHIVRQDRRGRFATELHVFDSPVNRSAVDALLGVSAGRTGFRTGGSRSDLRERESSQVAPAPGLPTPGEPTPGGPTAGETGAITNTGDEHGSKNTVVEELGDEQLIGFPQSHLPQVEGRTGGEVNGHFDFFSRAGTAKAAQAQADALTAWTRDHPEAAS